MPEMKFVLREVKFSVERLIAHQACSALAPNPQTEECPVHSTVTADVLQLFVSAINGEAIELTNENIDGLSALCDEFKFNSLSQCVESFKNSPIYRLPRLEDRFARLETDFRTLQNVVIAHQQSDLRTLKTGMDSQILSEFCPRRMEPVIISDFPELFAEFRGQRFSLLWRGSRDGFGACDFHSRCDGRGNTLTVILDTNGNIFGGFTPVEWESRQWNRKLGKEHNGYKADPSLKSFILTLKNPHNIPARRFALKPEQHYMAMYNIAENGPNFGDMGVSNNSNTNTSSHSEGFGVRYVNDTGLHPQTILTGSKNFKVKEIEMFEIVV
jgi:hypothetical protein